MSREGRGWVIETIVVIVIVGGWMWGLQAGAGGSRGVNRLLHL